MNVKCSCKVDLTDLNLNKSDKDDIVDQNNKLKCYKCENIAVIYSRGNTCKDCFINLFSKNFRSNLRTKCLNDVGKQEFLAILASGDYVSTSLIHSLFCRNNDRHFKVDLDESVRTNGVSSLNLTKITDSDDIKLRLILNVENPFNEDDFHSASFKYFKTIESVFSKFESNCRFESVNESESLIESMVNRVRIANIKCCFFLHQLGQSFYHSESNIKKGLDLIGCNEDCEQFVLKFQQVFNKDSDFGLHIWRIIKLMNLGCYVSYFNHNCGHNQNILTNSDDTQITNGISSHFQAEIGSNKESNNNVAYNEDKLIHLLCADTMDDICKEVVYLTCLGLGSQVSYRSAFQDAVSLENVRILRPFKTFSDKEVSFYHRFNELDQLPRFYSTFSSNSSIMGCIGSFTEELHTRNSNGFHNIIKVTNKLIDTPNTLRCSICEDFGNKRVKVAEDVTNQHVCNACEYFSMTHSDDFEYFKNKFNQARSHESKVANGL